MSQFFRDRGDSWRLYLLMSLIDTQLNGYHSLHSLEKLSTLRYFHIADTKLQHFSQMIDCDKDCAIHAAKIIDHP